MEAIEQMTRFLISAGHTPIAARMGAREIHREYVRRLETRLTTFEMFCRASDNMAVRW